MTQVPPSFSPKPVASAAGEGVASTSGGVTAGGSGGFATAWRQHSAPSQPQPPVKAVAAGGDQTLTVAMPQGEPAVVGNIVDHLTQEVLELPVEGVVGELALAASTVPEPLPPVTMPSAPLTPMAQAALQSDLSITPAQVSLVDPAAAEIGLNGAAAAPIPAYPPLSDVAAINLLDDGARMAAPASLPAATSLAMARPSGNLGAASVGGDGLQTALLDATAEQLDTLTQLQNNNEVANAAAAPRATRELAAAPLGLPPGVKVSYPAELPVGHQDWAERMAERGVALLARGLNSAEVRLDPPELGAMQIRIHVRDDVATVQFVSPHAHVREALDQTAARLREMLSEQGFREVQTHISDGRGHSRREGQGGQSPANAGDGMAGADGAVAEATPSRPGPAQGVMGVDQFV